MPVGSSWTNPTTLDLTTGQKPTVSGWEAFLGNLNFAGGASGPRRATYGTASSANPNIAANGGTWSVTVNLADAVTPVAAALGLYVSGFADNVKAYITSLGNGTVGVEVVNWGSSSITYGVTVYVVAPY